MSFHSRIELFDHFTEFFIRISRIVGVEHKVGHVFKLCLVELDCVFAHKESENLVDVIGRHKSLDVSGRDLHAVQEGSDISENGVVLDERELDLGVFLLVAFFTAVFTVCNGQRLGFAGGLAHQAHHEFAHFVCVHSDAGDIEVAKVDEQTAVCAFVVALFVLVAIA